MGTNTLDRIAGTWFAGGSFTVDLNITDGNMHQSTARRQTVDMLDANGNVLNTQSLTNSFNDGVYLVSNVRGHVKVRVTLTAGSNSVISGLFFGAG